MIYLFEVIYCFSCRYFEQHFAQKLFERGNLLLSKKSPTVQCSRIMQEPLFWEFVPAWTDTSMFSRYIQTRPCKVFSVPTTPETDWNLKIQTSPKKEDTLNSNRLKSPTFTDFNKILISSFEPVWKTPPPPPCGVSITLAGQLTGGTLGVRHWGTSCQAHPRGPEKRVKRFSFQNHLGVSKNMDFPSKWMVKIMENPIFQWMIWGENPLFSETLIWDSAGVPGSCFCRSLSCNYPPQQTSTDRGFF